MRRPQLPARLALRAIAAYQAGTSNRPRACVYDESCSNYARRLITERGLVRGGWNAFRRYRTCTVVTGQFLSTNAE